MKRIAVSGIACALVIAVAVALAGCGSTAKKSTTPTYSSGSQKTTTDYSTSPQATTPSATTTSPASGAIVVMRDFAFNQEEVTVKESTKVTFRNEDSAVHDVAGSDFASKKLQTGGE